MADIGNRSFRVAAHERLGELLQVLKLVVDKYSELNSNDILSVAGELIKYVKGRSKKLLYCDSMQIVRKDSNFYIILLY